MSNGKPDGKIALLDPARGRKNGHLDRWYCSYRSENVAYSLAKAGLYARCPGDGPDQSVKPKASQAADLFKNIDILKWVIPSVCAGRKPDHQETAVTK